MHMYFIKCTCE